ncbi:hypothetical protein ES702_04084 [subsurface metagenome]
MGKYDNPEELQGVQKEVYDEYIEEGWSEEEALEEINAAQAARDELKKKESSRSSSQDEDLHPAEVLEETLEESDLAELKKKESSRISSKDGDLQKKKKRYPGDPGILNYPSMDKR